MNALVIFATVSALLNVVLLVRTAQLAFLVDKLKARK